MSKKKTFMDRTCPIYAMIRNKEVYYIVSAAGGQMPEPFPNKALLTPLF